MAESVAESVATGYTLLFCFCFFVLLLREREVEGGESVRERERGH